MTLFKRIGSCLAALLLGGAASFAQADENPVNWQASVLPAENGLQEIRLTGTIRDGWHTYSLQDANSPVSVSFSPGAGCTLEGAPYEIGEPQEIGPEGFREKVRFGEIIIAQKVRAGGPATISGTVTWRACNEGTCLSPADWDFTVNLDGKAAKADNNKNVIGNNEDVSSPVSNTITAGADAEASSRGSLWALILEAILWGFAMLLTPCVFPMVPMTVSFFLKGSPSPAAGRFKAAMYGLFIILLYTLPICLIIGLTRLVGGETVTADIFNWLSTHWLPNLLFFLIFMVFAASFFGAFELTLPASWANASDKRSDRGGLGGVFFMALTLVLVSFSCTGPIVGSVLIKSTRGEFWVPMITMLAFSVAFALPFTLFALFPSLLGRLRSGSGLNSVKVVLGFIEVALGLKFLSIPDQTYHWGLLDREVYLAIWIVTFTLLGFYLLGKIRFAHDEKVEKIGVTRLALAIATFSFVVYLIPGMWGAPLKALSGYLPPLQTQDFVVWNQAGGSLPASAPAPASSAATATLRLPLGLDGTFSLEEGLQASRAAGKPLFVDFTGHGCMNCREMEARVWSDPRVLALLRDRFVITALYTDDKTQLPLEQWITAENGKVLKDMGRINSYIARTRFGVNAQPSYAILSGTGERLGPLRGYSLDVEGFLRFLEEGLARYEAAH